MRTKHEIKGVLYLYGPVYKYPRYLDRIHYQLRVNNNLYAWEYTILLLFILFSFFHYTHLIKDKSETRNERALALACNQMRPIKTSGRISRPPLSATNRLFCIITREVGTSIFYRYMSGYLQWTFYSIFTYTRAHEQLLASAIFYTHNGK